MPLAVLFLLINARILGKNLFDVDYKSLQKMKTQEYEQKIKITRLKKGYLVKEGGMGEKVFVTFSKKNTK